MAGIAVIGIGLFDEGAHMILRGKNGGDELGGCRNLTLADTVEGRFAMMGESGKRLEAEHRTRALQRMKAAEHGVDEVLVFEVVVEVEKAGFDRLEAFGRFGTEYCDWIKRAHLPRTFFTILTRFSGSNGFVSQPVAPAALARALRSASDSVVRKMIGTPA